MQSERNGLRTAFSLPVGRGGGDEPAGGGDHAAFGGAGGEEGGAPGGEGEAGDGGHPVCLSACLSGRLLA